MATETRPATGTRGDPEAVAALTSRLRGTVVQPGDPGFDDARAVWNGMVDRYPALIIRCAGTADVREAVRYARHAGLPVAVRGGGHNVSGNAVCDGGLVIDLSSMRGVRVDPASRTVRAQGGVTIGDLDRETQVFGLAVPMGVVTATGIAGLTLGGGLGWLRRRYGLSCDNLISADVVTAAGEVVTANPTERPDLLWGLCGGGGNFGVVTSFEFQAHPVGPEVAFAMVLHSHQSAPEALRGYRRWAVTAPDEISSLAVLWHVPEEIPVAPEHHGTPGLVFLAMHSGDPVLGEEALRPLRAIGSPLADLTETTSYLAVQQFFDADYPAHVLRYYWKSRFLADLSDDAIDLLVEGNAQSPSPLSTIDIWQMGGAAARRGPRQTPFGDRSAPFLVNMESNWERPEDDDAGVAWARDLYERLVPFAAGGSYLNFPGMYEAHDLMVRDTFGENLDRLVALKRAYDPDNLFRLNHNISPG